jgi:hypothetical protein
VHESAPVARVSAPLLDRYGGPLLLVLVAHALVTAVLRLNGAFDAQLFVPEAPVDLLIRMDEVGRWFSGATIYRDVDSANYPPASYTLLWPLLGWLPERPTRLLFGLSTVVSLVAIGVLALRAGGAERLPGRLFLAVFVLPLGATQITVWIGQLGLHVLACLMGAAAVLFGVGSRDASDPHRPPASPARDLLASGLLAASLVKPTLSAPVVVALLLVSRRWRPWVLTGAIYLGLTLAATAFQEGSVLDLVAMWLGREDVMNLPMGSVNTYLWLHWLGVQGSMLPASLVWLAALCVWTWRHRRIDPWLVLGVAGLVGRLWIHHRAFDDVLLVLPALALVRILTGTPSRAGPAALGALLLVGSIYLLGHAPWSWVNGQSYPLWLVTEVGRTVAWTGALGFLLWQAHHDRTPGPRGDHARPG